MAKKILALVSEPVSGEALKQAVGRERAEVSKRLPMRSGPSRRKRSVDG